MKLPRLFRKTAQSAPASNTVQSLSRLHFHWTELFASETAKELGIDNSLEANVSYPQAQILIWNGHFLVDQLEIIRKFVGVPLEISSGYRCKALNTAIGGSPTSQHMQLQAADIWSPQLTLKEIFGAIRELHLAKKIHVNQCLIERGCVHYASYRDAAKNQGYFGSWGI